MENELADKRILLVDDDSDIVDAMRAALADSGATVDAASDGNKAVEKLSADPPDLIVLDMMLPKRSGFLVMERVRQQRTPEGFPRVIMITGNQGTRHRVYAEALGIDLYLNKPFRMEKLLDGIKDLLT